MREGSILKLYTEMGTKTPSQNTRAFFYNLSALQISWQIVSVVRKRAFNITNDYQVFLQQVVLKVVSPVKVNCRQKHKLVTGHLQTIQVT